MTDNSMIESFIQELIEKLSLTDTVYLNPAMPYMITTKKGVVVFKEHGDDCGSLSNSIEILIIIAAKKKQGFGTEMPKLINEIADKLNVKLSAFPAPFMKSGLNKEQLIRWCIKYGYKFCTDFENYMIRLPKLSETKKG